MGFLKQIVWPYIKPTLEAWMINRALVLPASKVADIARKAGTSSAVVLAVQSEIQAFAISEVEKFKP